jgi:GDPmannose 4,6-dehydratase
MAFKAVDIEIEWQGTDAKERGVDTGSGKTLVKINPKFYRPAEVDLLIGDPSKAREELGWKPQTTLEDLCQMMVKSDISRNEAGTSF